MSGSEEEDDDWFYDSITRYKSLLMFDFLSPVKFIELCNHNSVCFVFEEKNCHNELSHLSLPRKLTVSQENEGLVKDSDLKLISGGFSVKVISQVKSIFGTDKLLVSEENQPGLKIYETSEESGAILCSNTIDCDLVAPRISHNKSDVIALVSQKKQGLILLDLQDLSIKYNILLNDCDGLAENTLHPEFISPTLLGLCNTALGSIAVYDIRCKKILRSIRTGETSQINPWTLSTSFFSTNHIADNTDDSKLGLLSTNGVICLFDVRNPQTHLCCEKQKNICIDSVKTKPKLRFSPNNSSIISTSGFNANINLFNYSSGVMESIFVHDGHVRNCDHNENLTTDHIWYKNLILSSCSNLSVHCWQHSL